ncbi:MAG: SRPBCC domain-containing protein, partial [Bacteroidetes bacterium]|nr:SRPBCC domain-containing protein [Bacteroidota bacterium]
MADFKKYYVIKAAPEEIYQAIVNPKSLELWTGEKAVMSEEPGSEFSLWDDSICGKNLEFEPNKL